MQYSEACSCFRKNAKNVPECENVFKVAFPTLARKRLERISPRVLCDRQKRDVSHSDDATEEDFQLFKEVRQLRPRFRREAQIGPLSRENASRYCAERISETKIGKLYAKLGVDVHSLVDTCSDDVVVSTLYLLSSLKPKKLLKSRKLWRLCTYFDVGLSNGGVYAIIVSPSIVDLSCFSCPGLGNQPLMYFGIFSDTIVFPTSRNLAIILTLSPCASKNSTRQPELEE